MTRARQGTPGGPGRAPQTRRPGYARDPHEAHLDAALQYARRGWPVFPCHWPILFKGGLTCSCRGFKTNCMPAKHPQWDKNDLQHGLLDAATDEVQIRTWWERWLCANIGLRTGKPSGVIVLDVDPRHGGELTLADLIAEYGRLPETAESQTGGGGRHLLFAYPGREVRNDAGKKLGAGLDIRGDGGYIILPPSLHISGQRYEWESSSHPDDVPLAPMPGWLLDRLVDPPKGAGQLGPPADLSGRIAQGQRNATLVSLAGSLRRRGLVRPVIEAALLTVNAAQCEPPLGEDEVRGIAKSVCRYDPAEDGGPAVDPERQQQEALEWLRAQPELAGLPLVGVRKLGRKRGEYELILIDGSTVELGTAPHVLTPRDVRAAIMDAASLVIPELSRKDWTPFAKAIVAAAGVGEDIGTDANSETRGWLQAWTAHRPKGHAQSTVDLGDETQKLTVIQQLQQGKFVGSRRLNFSSAQGFFWDTQGAIYLRLRSLQEDLAAHHVLVTQPDLVMRLRRLGFRKTQLQAREGETIAKVRVWQSTPDLNFDDE